MNSPDGKKYSSFVNQTEKSQYFLGMRSDNMAFKKLCRGPKLTLPTVILFLVSAMGTAGIAYATITQFLPLSYAMAGILMGIFGYLQFSVIHDAAHRAVSSIAWVNELIGNLGLVFMGSPVSLSVIRRVHIQHHVYANGAKDPDHWIHHGSPLTLPLRWATLELFYVYYYLRHQHPRPLRELAPVLVGLVMMASLLTTLVVLGYGQEVFWLWFIPSRIASFLISAVFVFLPHFPHEVAQNENPYRATPIRLGCEWLLTPVLAYQNYHLIHHLYPTAPFYNMKKIWNIKSKETEFIDRNPSIVDAFGLTPRN